MNIRGLIILLSVATFLVFGSISSAIAGSGVFPDSPVQVSPIEYGGGYTSLEFKFYSYNSEYTNNNGTFFGFPIAYQIQVYRGSTLIIDDDVWSTSVTYDDQVLDETYTWWVRAVYEFYDMDSNYAGMEYSSWSSATFKNIPAAKPSPPVPILPVLKLDTNEDSFVAGKRGLYMWYFSLGALSYQLEVAKDSSFSDKIATYNTEAFMVLPVSPIADLPADGSRIFWRVKAFNEFGDSGFSPVASFINDCNMPSIGTSGTLSHIDTCTDEVTRIGGNYFLKDMSRRKNDNSHGHNGRMQTDASIITGLNSENTTNGVERGIGKQIAPMTDLNNVWDEANMQDAVSAQYYTGRFYDYLLSTFSKTAGGESLNSFDGSGRSFYNLINGLACSIGTVAYWHPETLNVHFCKDGASKLPELVGHEWGHAVTGTASTIRGTNSLGGSGEAGALDEAFSDWIGLSFKYSHFNQLWSNNPWYFAPGTTFSDNFADIAQIPNYYNANNYKFNAGVQTNLRLPNTMFYLLAAGGTHPFSKINVQGIGIERAMQVAVRANMDEWARGATFLNAASGMLNSVDKYLFQDPNIRHQLKNAWAAVGVCNNPDGTIAQNCNFKLPEINAASDSNKGSVVSTAKFSTINNTQMQYEPVWGQSVTVTASPKSGYKFAYWSEDSTILADAPQSYTFTATADRNLVANFIPQTGNDFGVVNVGQSSFTQTITIGNFVQPPQPVIYLGTVQLGGSNPGDFVVTGDNCSGQMLLQNSTCGINVIFKPLSTGAKQGTLSITATANGQTVLSESYQLTGTGIEIPSLSVNSSSTLGGTAALSGSQIWGGTATATATASPGYSFAGWLEDGAVVSSSASYSFSVTGSRYLIALFSAKQPMIVAAPSTGYFGNVAAGLTSPAHTFTVTNNGQQELSILSIAMSGINRSDFNVIDNSCTQAIAPGLSCYIKVSLLPTKTGVRIARLGITSNDPATPDVAIELSGYGGAPAMISYYGSTSPNYATSIQKAYNDAANGMEIRLWATDFNETLYCNRPQTVTLRGGYNGRFSSRVGKSVVQGAVVISSGTLIADDLQIGGSSFRTSLSVEMNYPGAGAIASLPAGLNCTDSCTASFVTGDLITLTASPIGDATFVGWSGGGCSGTGTCQMTLRESSTVKALFSAARMTASSSSVSLGSVQVGASSDAQTVTISSSGSQSLTIGTISPPSSDFTLITDNCSGHTLPPLATCTLQITFTPTSEGAKTASIIIPSNTAPAPGLLLDLSGIGTLPTLYVSKTGAGNGIVNSYPSVISCGTTCSAGFYPNSTVSLTAAPDYGYIFTGWSGACSGTGDCSITILDKDVNVVASFDDAPLSSCSANPVKMGQDFYPTIQAAYNGAPDNSLIQLLSINFLESFTATRPIKVTVDGGYKCSFISKQSDTVIIGEPSITAGSVTLENILISQ